MSMLHCETKKHVDEWNIWHELENKRVIYKMWGKDAKNTNTTYLWNV